MHVWPLLARATPADVDLADFCGADRRLDGQQAMPAKAAPLFIRDGAPSLSFFMLLSCLRQGSNESSKLIMKRDFGLREPTPLRELAKVPVVKVEEVVTASGLCPVRLPEALHRESTD